MVAPQNTSGYTGLQSIPGKLRYFWNDLVGRNQQREQNEWNRQQALEQYQREVQMWNMQNEYNSPISQMERYQAAGLNPNLIYSSGNASAGNASGYPSYQPAQGVGRPSGLENLAKLMGFASGIAGLYGQLQQADVAKANARRISAETDWINELNGYRSELLKNQGRYWSERAFGAKLEYRPFNAIDADPLKFNNWWDLKEKSPALFVQYPSLLRHVQDFRKYDYLEKYQGSYERERYMKMSQDALRAKKENEWFDFGHFNSEAGKILANVFRLLYLIR